MIETAFSDATATDDQPCPSANGLEFYFSSTRAGGLGSSEILRSTRPSTTAPWSVPTFVTELNSSAGESSPTLTADGLTIYLLSARVGAPNPPNNAIFVATRPNASTAWSTPVLVTQLATTSTHRDVDVSGNGNEILYTRFNSAISRIEVVQARRAKPTDPFGTPVVLSEFATVGTSLGVYSVSVSRDRTEMFLAAGFATAAGGQEILSTRFTGIGQDGLATTSSPLRIAFRDGNGAGNTFVGTFALGDTGFALGSRTVPLDPDPLFVAAWGGVAGITTGYLGVLDAQGEATALVGPSIPALTGIKVYTGFFSLDGAQPFGVRTISNSIALEFLP